MVIDEGVRHRMHSKLEELMGEELGNALMAHLPPVGWADVATKRDLEELERRLDLRFEQMVSKVDFERTLRKHTLAMAGLQTATLGIVLAIARL